MAVDERGRTLPKGIRKKGNRYYGRIMVDGSRHTVIGDTVTEVKKKMATLQDQLENGTFLQENKIKIAEWFEIWINDYKSMEVKQGTITLYRNTYKSTIYPIFGNTQLQKLKTHEVQKLYNDLAKKGLSKSYIGTVNKIMNGMCKQAVYNGIIRVNPVTNVQIPKKGIAEPKTHKALTKEEQVLFMAYAQDSHYYNLFVLMLNTGMRIGEALGLKFSDIDRNKNVVHIQRTLKQDNINGFYLDTPKTKSSIRDIPLLPKANEAIRDQRKYIFSNVQMMDGYIFTNIKGGFVNKEGVQREINRICRNIQADHPAFERFTAHGRVIIRTS